MNAKTLEAIRRHGLSLLAAFPNATEKDPVALCKKLRRIETATHRVMVDYCNGVFQDDNEGTKMDAVCDKAKARTLALLGESDGVVKHCGFLHINRDPRGYSLKLESEWTRAHNDKVRCNCCTIHTDMGGYGILAPNLNQ